MKNNEEEDANEQRQAECRCCWHRPARETPFSIERLLHEQRSGLVLSTLALAPAELLDSPDGKGKPLILKTKFHFRRRRN